MTMPPLTERGSSVADKATFTAGPYFAGCQNDSLFIVAGRPPAVNNDYPWHDAPRVCLAKVFGPSEGDCLPVDADANAALFSAAPDLFEALVNLMENPLFQTAVGGNPNAVDAMLDHARAALAKARGQ